MNPVLRTARLEVATLAPGDAHALLRYFERNAERLEPWEYTAPPEARTLAHWEAKVTGALELAREDRGVLFVAREPGNAEIVARIGLSQIARGAMQAAFLGYSLDGAYEGRGFASEAVAAVVGYAFDVLGLHRVMATYRPENERSAKLLAGLGFVREGFATSYLFLDGAWRDSVLTALVNPCER